MTIESETRAERFRQWKEDLLAREPQAKRPMKPPQHTWVSKYACCSCGKLFDEVTGPAYCQWFDHNKEARERQSKIVGFEQWRHEEATLNELDVLEKRNAYEGECTECGIPMKGMTVRERAEHHIREEVEKMRKTDGQDPTRR